MCMFSQFSFVIFSSYFQWLCVTLRCRTYYTHMCDWHFTILASTSALMVSSLFATSFSSLLLFFMLKRFLSPHQVHFLYVYVLFLFLNSYGTRQSQMQSKTKRRKINRRKKRNTRHDLEHTKKSHSVSSNNAGVCLRLQMCVDL